MEYAPQIIDAALVIVILVSVALAFKNGLLTSVVNLTGNIAGLIIAWVAANEYSLVVFQKLFRERLVERTYEYIQNSAHAVDAKEMVQAFISGLPPKLMETFIAKATEISNTLETKSMEAAQGLVDTVLDPIIALLIGVILFAVILLLFKIFTAMLAKALKIINRVPVIGFANRMGGAAVGVLIGIINVILISCLLSIVVIITQNTLSFLNIDILSHSKLLAITSRFNPFV